MNTFPYINTICNKPLILALFKTATSMFGTIDIVINNAGIFKESNWCRMIDINLVKYQISFIFYCKTNFCNIFVERCDLWN